MPESALMQEGNMQINQNIVVHDFRKPKPQMPLNTSIQAFENQAQ